MSAVDPTPPPPKDDGRRSLAQRLHLDAAMPNLLSKLALFGLVLIVGYLLNAFLLYGELFGIALGTKVTDYRLQILYDIAYLIVAAVSLNLILGHSGQLSIGHSAFVAIGGYVAAMLTLYGLPVVAGAVGIGPNEVFTTQREAGSLDLVPVFTWLGYLWPILAMLVAGVVAAIVGFLIGVPCLRLRGDYLAIVTLGFGEVVRIFFTNVNEVGGYELGGGEGTASLGLPLTPMLVFVTTVVSVYILANLVRSTLGKSFLTVRENEIAADAIGISTAKFKIQAFVIGAFFAGVAGVIVAHNRNTVTPDLAGWQFSVELLTICVLGGTGSITGAIIAAVVFRLLQEVLRDLNDVSIPFEVVLAIGILAVVLVVAAIVLSVVAKNRVSSSRGPLLQTLTTATGVFAGIFVVTALVLWAKDDAYGLGIPPDNFRLPIFSLSLVAVMVLRPRGLMGRKELIHYLPLSRQARLHLTAAATPRETDLSVASAAQPREYATEDEPLLDVKDLTMRFGGLTAVDSFNLQIKPKELVGLIGPNGAGKTTLFNMLTGVYTPTEGSIVFEGREIQGQRPHRLNSIGLARTFQNIRLFGALSVLDNVRIARHVHIQHGLPQSVMRTPGFYREEQQTHDEAMALLRLFDLEEFTDEDAANLAYGDQRRLEIARALATEPKLLLLDEPAAGMNPNEKEELRRLIVRIRDQFGLTVLLIEHDMKMVMGLCERIAVLDYGKKIAEGAPQDIRQDPRVIKAYLGQPDEDDDA